MPQPTWPTKVATLALPTREAHVVASIWPGEAASLLFLAELNIAPPARQEFMAALTDVVEGGWSQATTTGRNAEALLEEVILRINPILKANERLFGNPLAPRYHLCLAVITGRALTLSSVGHLSALVVGQSSFTNILSIPKTNVAARATFHHLTSGQLEPGETLLLTTPALFDYLAPDKVYQVVGRQAPGLALREIEQLITTLEHHPPLGLMALRIEKKAAVTSTQKSINRLNETTSNTTLLLKPSLWTYLRRAWPLHQTVEQTEARAPETQTPKPQPSHSTDLTWADRLSHTRRRLTHLGAKLKVFTSRESIKASLSSWLEARLAAWRRLPLTKRFILAVALIALLGFSQSIVSHGRERLKSFDSERYNDLVTQLSELQAAAEGALIYHDDAKARSLLTEARQLLDSLPRTTPSREQQYEVLNRSLGLLEQRLLRRYDVTGLIPWTTLPQARDNGKWQNAITSPGGILVFGTSGEIVLLGTNATITPLVALPQSNSPLTLSARLGDYLLAERTDGHQFLINQKTKQVTEVTPPLKLIDVSFYENRIYTLTPGPHVIERANLQGGSITKPARWLRSSQGEIVEARSLTVDGSIYVTDGTQLFKYTLGLRREFNIQPISPPLTNITTLRTDSETDYLYLAAPVDKRLVVYDKTGKLLTQLFFPELPNVTAISVDTPTQTAYLLSQATVYRIPLIPYLTQSQ